MTFIRPLATLSPADLPVAGGKGANLGALIAAGLPVPDGFVITTAAYRAFVAANSLAAAIQAELTAGPLDRPPALEAASAAIRQHFLAGEIPADLAAAILAAYAGLGSPPSGHLPSGSRPAAIRSSATAEDLPDLSFAGQQDTYLNVTGAPAVLEAVKGCWASLWTARAIAYRGRNAIPHDEVALAVVVQRMVPSEVSGVLFTADPLSGRRTQTVIDATFGLGEALVAGQVEPDHYVVENATGHILAKTLGAKARAVVGAVGGGTLWQTDEGAAARQALTDDQIVALHRLGQQAAAAFGASQDVEWALAGGRLAILQSRPITSLYPLPAGLAGDGRETLFSFGSWQGMLDPYTPLGQDMFPNLVVGIARLFGARLSVAEQRIMLVAGERLYVSIGPALANPTGRMIVDVFIQSVDPVAYQVLQSLKTGPQAPAARNAPLSLMDHLWNIRALAPAVFSVLFNLAAPARGRRRLQRKIESALAYARQRCAAAGSPAALAAAIEEIIMHLPGVLLPHLVPGIAAGQAPLQILIRRTTGIPNGPELALELTRGLPYNVTTEMDLELWRLAQTIRSDPASAGHFAAHRAADLAAHYLAGALPPVAQAGVAGFLQTYGVRGVGEIDLGRPRWSEDPQPVFQSLQSYLQIDTQERSPAALFASGAEKARQAQLELEQAVRHGPFGWLKARLVRAAARRVRELGGLRETPKFAIIRLLGEMHRALLAAGQDQAASGVLRRPEDIFFFHLDELKGFDPAGAPVYQERIAERRAAYARELRRKRIPRIMLGDGACFYDAPAAPASPVDEDDTRLTGTPVSAGVVEGVVHVIHDPHREQLAPGEILVCPATDPAWTPLFLSAGGLVMEIGGLITHGSVVAREYGIPAVVGVSQATERLHTGQRVRVDGANGLVTVLG